MPLIWLRTTSALKVHTRAHTGIEHFRMFDICLGEKPYRCPSCDYSSITKRNLDRHIVNNHIRPGERKGWLFGPLLTWCLGPRQRRGRYRESPEEEWPTLVDGETEVIGDDHEYDGPRQQLSFNQFLDEDSLLKTNILQEDRQPA